MCVPTNSAYSWDIVGTPSLTHSCLLDLKTRHLRWLFRLSMNHIRYLLLLVRTFRVNLIRPNPIELRPSPLSLAIVLLLLLVKVIVLYHYKVIFVISSLVLSIVVRGLQHCVLGFTFPRNTKRLCVICLLGRNVNVWLFLSLWLVAFISFLGGLYLRMEPIYILQVL